MNIPMWRVRLLNTPFNPKVVYDGHPTLFTIKLYHGGEFTKYPDVCYIDGTINYVDMVDIDEFSVHELDAIMKGNDQDVANFSQYVSEHKVMKVYTEHGETRLLTYFLNSKPVTKVTLVQLYEPHEDVKHIDEAPDDQSKETPVMTTPIDNLVDVVPTQANQPEIQVNDIVQVNEIVDVVPTQANQPEIQVNEIVQVVSLSPGYNRRRVMRKDGLMASCSKKIYFDDIGETEQIAKDFVEAATDFDIRLYQQILQSNVDGVIGTDMHDVNEPQMDEENQAQMDDENQAKIDEEADSDDSDYWVDEDNVIKDLEVDMRDFNMSIDTEVEVLDKRARNPRQHESDEEADELDVIDNDAFDSMDEDSDQDRKRRPVLKQLSKEKSCSLGEVHKCHFKIGQKYNSKQELEEKIKMHALETKKNIAFKKNDKSRLRAICNGVVAFNNDVVGGPTQTEKSKGKSKEKDKQGGTSQEKADSSCPWMLHASRSTDASSWGMKKGFKACLRDFLGLDGAHMKGPYPGQILTTVGLDSNNGIYPLAYSIVEIENCESWKWFLKCLDDDLDLHAMSNFTFVSDVQKLANCSHVLSIATTVPEFNHYMHQFSLYDKLAYEWLKSIPPQHWAKSDFTEWCGDEKYQVKGPWNDQHVVDMHERVCSCRKWELTDIPSRHVIYVLYNKVDHGERVHELHTYVHKVHWLQTWKTAYGYKVEPIKGRALWPRSECPMQITPPPHRNQPGRPKRKRRQSMEEKSQSQSQRSDVGPSEIHGHGPHGSGKLTRKFVSMTCSKCGNKGHNSRTCKDQGGT
ncbi:unnamed protein product [Lactuca saligna]|uniref:CCHC-type domain-containing protein n=1 Tax=Lactuca saligna TaxID=75948 RepID=A0AA35V126_LACSI|nr:unnamed protein product [Lactuca saligna]